MSIKPVIACCVLLTAAISPPRLGVGESDTRLKLGLDLAATIHEFARQHGLSDHEAWSLVGETVIAGPAIKKAGVGTIGKDLYVFPDAKRNKLLLGDSEWEGRSAREPEMVVIDHHRVLGSLGLGDASSLEIVVFSPDEVRYLDFSNNTGGKYTRSGR